MTHKDIWWLLGGIAAVAAVCSGCSPAQPTYTTRSEPLFNPADTDANLGGSNHGPGFVIRFPY